MTKAKLERIKNRCVKVLAESRECAEYFYKQFSVGDTITFIHRGERRTGIIYAVLEKDFMLGVSNVDNDPVRFMLSVDIFSVVSA